MSVRVLDPKREAWINDFSFPTCFQTQKSWTGGLDSRGSAINSTVLTCLHTCAWIGGSSTLQIGFATSGIRSSLCGTLENSIGEKSKLSRRHHRPATIKKIFKPYQSNFTRSALDFHVVRDCSWELLIGEAKGTQIGIYVCLTVLSLDTFQAGEGRGCLWLLVVQGQTNVRCRASIDSSCSKVQKSALRLGPWSLTAKNHVARENIWLL